MLRLLGLQRNASTGHHPLTVLLASDYPSPQLASASNPARVAFVLLEDFEQDDPQGIADTLEAGVQEGQ